MDQLLHSLQNADPTDGQPDPVELLHLEAACHQMGPLIDEKLEDIDRKHSELSELNLKVMEALSLYTKLMNEDPMYSMYTKLQSQQYYVQSSGVPASPVYPGQPASGTYVTPGNTQMNHIQSYSVPPEQLPPFNQGTVLPSVNSVLATQSAQTSYNNSTVVISVPGSTYASQNIVYSPPATANTADVAAYQNTPANIAQVPNYNVATSTLPQATGSQHQETYPQKALL